MDLDLSDDQVALRDGIRALLEGRFNSERVRAGFDRQMFDELADEASRTLRQRVAGPTDQSPRCGPTQMSPQ